MRVLIPDLRLRTTGTMTWTIDSDTVDIGPGEAVCVRRGQIHGFGRPRRH